MRRGWSEQARRAHEAAITRRKLANPDCGIKVREFNSVESTLLRLPKSDTRFILASLLGLIRMLEAQITVLTGNLRAGDVLGRKP